MDDVLASWGLAGHRIERVTGGATNETWSVSHGHTVAFLRRYRTTDRSSVEREHQIIEAVADAGLRTPRPMRSIEGSTVVTSDDALFALFDAASGRQLEPPSLTSEHASSAGRFLAELHHATATLPTDGVRSWKLDWEAANWASRVRSTAERIPHDSSSDVDRWAYRRSLEQAAWLDDPACAHSYTPLFSAQVIHGDYQHANLFFDGDDVSGVIDWDTASAMCRGFEIVRACSFMFQLEPDKTGAFVEGYRSTHPLSPAELLDGVKAWGCFADHHVWAIEERYLKGNVAAERFIPRQPFEPFGQSWEKTRIK